MAGFTIRSAICRDTLFFRRFFDELLIMNEPEIFILADGTVKFLYYDELKPLLEIGNVVVSRASHIDPANTTEGLKWHADLSPVNGPKLGPFETRDEAISAEIEWLTENYLNKQDS